MKTSKQKYLHQVSFGSETIAFELQKNERSTLSISVYPDLSVSVVAPKDVSIEKIEEKVRKRAPWILKQQIYFAQFLPNVTRREYRSGESFRYLGRQYRLKVLQGTRQEVSISSGYLKVTALSKGDQDEIKQLLGNWYRVRARGYFQKRLEICAQLFKTLNLPSFNLSVRKMNFRWGSCTKKGLIILNEDLIQAPSHCIDYVICHELTHLKVRNHTPEFFKILSKVMPDWEERRRRLERMSL